MYGTGCGGNIVCMALDVGVILYVWHWMWGVILCVGTQVQCELCIHFAPYMAGV